MTLGIDQVHATCVALLANDNWLGVLLRGPSGVGKSDLAIQLIDEAPRADRSACLVADDRVDLTLRDGQIFASPPAALAGLIEVRGLGVMPVPHSSDIPLGLVIDLVSHADEVSRLPDVQVTEMMGVSLPWMQLRPFEASNTAKVRLAVRGLPWNDDPVKPSDESQQ